MENDIVWAVAVILIIIFVIPYYIKYKFLYAFYYFANFHNDLNKASCATFGFSLGEYVEKKR